MATPVALAVSLLSGRLLAVWLKCIGAASADNPPALLSVAITAASAGIAASEFLLRMQRALLQGTLEYLWGSSDQGGLREAGGFAVLPTALLRHLPDAETHNPPASLPSLPRTSTCSNSPSKRARLDEGSSLAAFSTDDAEGAAGARGSPAGTPLTEVTLDGDYHAESDLKKPANSLEVHAS